MRTFAGYFFIFCAFLVLFLLINSFSKELEKFQPPQSYLDDKIAVKNIVLPQMSYITSADHEVISQITNEEKRINLSNEEIPQLLKDAFVVAEDRQFFEHKGIDFIAVGRAILKNAEEESITQGGSTITQQLARNLYLNQEKTYNRKLTELLYSLELEQHYSKDQLLQMYINAIYFGNGVYGIEAAAQFYFNKTAISLSDGELLFLAAIPNNPTNYDPLVNFNNTKARQERILDQLVLENKLASNMAELVKNEAIALHHGSKIDLFPDYVTYVEQELRQLIAHKEGLTESLSNKQEAIRQKTAVLLDKKVKEVLEAGVIIHTAIDTELQNKAKESLQQGLPFKEIEGAIVVIQHHTHELVSLIGAKDYKKYSFHRGFQSFRQPGSTIKPLLVYAPYIEQTSASLTDKIDASAFCSNGYCPQNYGGAKYGLVSLKSAFMWSYNTPAVRLLQQNGLRQSFAYLNNFNFTKVDEHDYLLPAAIGGFSYGMSPLELTAAYTSFQNGSFQQPRAIRSVTDKAGNILYEWDEEPLHVWSEETARKIRTLLTAVVLEGTAKGASFSTDGYIGGKTGTTNNTKDLWFIGLNDNYTTGVWVGKDLPANIEYIRQPQLSIWKTIMREL